MAFACCVNVLYSECAHEQHVRSTLTLTLTLTHTITAYSVSGNVVHVRILICATRQKPCRKRVYRILLTRGRVGIGIWDVLFYGGAASGCRLLNNGRCRLPSPPYRVVCVRVLYNNSISKINNGIVIIRPVTDSRQRRLD